MARPVNSSDAKKLSKQHRQLLERLKNTGNTLSGLKAAVINCAQTVAKSESADILRDIPIEELNRDKRGFRLKSLHDSGYHTIADLDKASVYRLAEVNGISDEAAREIKKAVEQIAQTASKAAKLKLSADKKTPAYSALILAISKYRHMVPYLNECLSLYNEYSKSIRKLLEELKPSMGALKWFFATTARRERSVEVYDTLSQLMNGQYGVTALASLDELRLLNAMSTDKAWDDFTANPVSFMNILEELTPQLIGTDDTLYGLPQELALRIQEQPLHLEGLSCELRRYQEWGVKYILHQKRVLLGDEMGLGKTVQAIAAMVSLRNEGATHFVVVCPASVLSNWCREITKMSYLSVIKVHGASKNSALRQWIDEGGVAVTTYETTGSFELTQGFEFSMMVVDEAHYIKNPQAQRSENVRRISTFAQRLLFMTGTALENKVEEMISLIQVLQDTVAQSVRGMEFMSSAPMFREKVAPVYYRRRREDVLTELPELIETKEWCEMCPQEEHAYEQALLSGSFPQARRVSWNVDDITKSSKANRMIEIVQEAQDEGRKVIVFTFFLDTMNKITQIFGDRCIGPINGSVPPQKRQEMVDEFDKAPAGTVLAAQIQAGGTGLNIQSASVVIICEPQFKPSIENQAISRAYRMGQTRNVLVYRLLCDDTVDERITQILEEKQAVFDAFADESAVASESLELDEKTFSNIIKDELQRISEKKDAAQDTTQ